MLPPNQRNYLYDGVPSLFNAPVAHNKADLAGADAVIIGVPYMFPLFGFDADLTPRKLRQASTRYSTTYLPEYDLEVFEALRVVDYGDAVIDPSDIPASVANVERMVTDALEAGALPITLGGSAPCSGYSSALALSKFLEGAPVGAVNLDAHGDNREHWQGDASLSAMTWVRHQLALRGFEAKNHVQLGMRGPGNPKANAQWYKDQGATLITGYELHTQNPLDIIRRAVNRASEETRGIWFGIDWDVLDMSANPEWVYPEPMGMASADLLKLAFEVGRRGCLACATMSSPAQAPSMHWIVGWMVLHLLAGVAVRKGKAQATGWL